MKTISIDIKQISYDPITDTLYVKYGDYGDSCTDVVDISPNISVLFGYPDGEFAGIEIFDFKEVYGDLPSKLDIKTDQPLTIEFPSFKVA